jgi:carboxynorspermidine decarboxylase
MQSSVSAIYSSLKNAAFVLHEKKLISNLELISSVKKQAGIKIILALKGFSMWHTFPLVFEYLDGATASSLNEAKLIAEHMGTLAHSYFPVFLPHEFDEVAALSSHITFNSLNQFHRFYPILKEQYPAVSPGIRVNPGFSKVEVEMYNPTAPGSRLGIDLGQLESGLPEGVEGIHFHALCENNSYDLEETLAVLESKIGHLLTQVKWVNMGGGHLMTHRDYDTEHLIGLLTRFREKYGVEIILEPGSAIAWQTGDLVANIVDIVENHGVKTLMTDVSFTAHMPDTLEMPYRPEIVGANADGTGTYQYRIGGTSCLSGDFMYEYGFDTIPEIGDKLILRDMIHYTLVKTTMFNGVPHPDIGIIKQNGLYQSLRQFTFEDYEMRMD